MSPIDQLARLRDEMRAKAVLDMGSPADMKKFADFAFDNTPAFVAERDALTYERDKLKGVLESALRTSKRRRTERDALNQQLAERDAEIERLRPTGHQLEAAGTLAAWVRNFGHAEDPAFIADVVMLIEAIKGGE